nr:MAG TPA: RelB antitoxin [Caudoviricetes sp.]
MNLMQMIQFGGNPKMILSQMMSNSQFSNNPIMKNTFDMMNRGDSKGLEQLARNLCKEKGINPEEVINQFKR